MDEKEIQDIVYDIKQFLENACMELASEAVSPDTLFNDAAMMEDLVCDRIFDSASTDEDRIAIAEALADQGHSALQKACRGFIARRR